MIGFKEFLSESKSDSCSTEFGEYLFGEFKDYWGQVKEKDTDIEKMVFKKIMAFIKGEFADKGADNILIKALSELKKCQGAYSEILKPNKTHLFRGIGIEKPDRTQSIPQNFKDSSRKIDWGDDTTETMVGKWTYKGHSKIQSWTPDFDIAFDFTMRDARKNKDLYLFGVMEYNFDDSELLFNTKFLDKIAKKFGYVSEDEIIRIENKPIKVNLYVEKIDYLIDVLGYEEE